MTGWDERPEGRYGPVEITIAGPDRYYVKLSTATGTTTQGLYGEVAWVAAADRVQRLAGDDAARLRRIASRYRPVRERPADLQTIGVERIEGRDTFVATSRVDAKTTLALYFDAVTGLLRREATTFETVLIPLQEQVDYDDYRDVNGVQLPFQIRTTEGAPYGLVTKTFLQIRRNVPVDEALFRPPSGA